MDIELVLAQGDSLDTKSFAEALKSLEKARTYPGNALFTVINSLTETQLKQRKQIEEQADQIKHQQGRICHLEKLLSRETEKRIDMEKHQMSNNIVITGLAESPQEDVYKSLKQLFSQKLGITSEIKLDIAHRQGPRPAGLVTEVEVSEGGDGGDAGPARGSRGDGGDGDAAGGARGGGSDDTVDGTTGGDRGDDLAHGGARSDGDDRQGARGVTRAGDNGNAGQSIPSGAAAGPPGSQLRVPRPRPIIARLVHRSDKALIFNNCKLLKGTKIFINSQLPNEIKSSQNLLRAKGKSIKDAYEKNNIQCKIQISDEKLIVNGTVKRDLKRERGFCVDKDVSSYEAGKAMDIEHTGLMSFGSSKFQGHLVKINDVALIDSAIARLTTDEAVAKASHNAWAYRKADDDEHMRDDMEHGAGQAILSVLQENNITGYLVVITRWYYGHIGASRFDAFRAAAKKAIERLL